MHDREEVLGRIPEGLRRCDQCGELHGRCLDPEPPDRSVLRPVTVSCLCEGIVLTKRAARSGANRVRLAPRA